MYNSSLFKICMALLPLEHYIGLHVLWLLRKNLFIIWSKTSILIKNAFICYQISTFPEFDLAEYVTAPKFLKGTRSLWKLVSVLVEKM